MTRVRVSARASYRATVRVRFGLGLAVRRVRATVSTWSIHQILVPILTLTLALILLAPPSSFQLIPDFYDHPYILGSSLYDVLGPIPCVKAACSECRSRWTA